MHNPQWWRAYAAPGVRSEQGDGRRIVLLLVALKDVPQQKQEGG